MFLVIRMVAVGNEVLSQKRTFDQAQHERGLTVNGVLDQTQWHPKGLVL
jgi:hypothetical protein